MPQTRRLLVCRIGLLAAIILVVAGYRAANAESLPSLAQRDWSVDAKPSLIKNPPSLEEVQSFVKSLSADYYPPPTTFTFANLRGGDKLSLVAVAGESEVEVIDQDVNTSGKDPGFRRQYLARFAKAGDAASVVQDVDHNGKLELVFEDSTPSEPPCRPHWPVIYAWTGSSYEDVSVRFPGFYRERLPELRRTLAQIQATRRSGTPGSPAPTQWNVEDEDCVEAEIGKFERNIGISRNAGLDDAERWAASSDSDERLFAIGILRDIGTAEAFERMRVMMSDPDEEVAGDAEEYWTDSPEAQKEMRTSPPLLAADWSMNAKPNLAVRPPSKAAVAALVAFADNLRDRKNGEPTHTLPNDADTYSFQFVNLRGSGVLSLVVETDLNDRLGNYTIQVLDKAQTGLMRYFIAADWGTDSGSVAQDLDGSGKYELVVDLQFISQCSACCNPTIPFVFGWKDGAYRNVGARFPGFYRNRLAKLQERSATVERGWASAVKYRGMAEPQDCAKIEAAKIERLLGSPEAGLDYAIELSESSDGNNVRLAAQIFADIGTPSAIAHLDALGADPKDPMTGLSVQKVFSGKFVAPAEIPQS